MFHPTRGGTRGGKDQFKWDDVKTDKDRECYLGHSLMAPVGRWQQGKDLTWYAKDKKSKTKVKSEFQTAKDLEEKALMAALGYKVVDKEEKSDEEESEAESSESDPEPVKKKSKKERRDRSDSRERSKAKVGPQTIESGSKKDLDNILLKLVAKNGIENVLKALGDDGSCLEKQKSKKSKKKSKKHRSKHDSDDSDSDSGEDRGKKHKSSSSRKSKKSKKSKRSSSDESDSSSNDSN